ncbi:MAG: cell division protein FtsL [Ruminococcus sp.]|nr:cell division protein FtsL [Ruminococcus sp.]
MDDKDSVYYYNDSSNYRAAKTVHGGRIRTNPVQVSSENNTQAEEAAESKTGSVLLIIFVSFVAVAMLGMVIYSFDRRNSAYNEVNSLNSKLSLAQAENVRLQTEIDNKLSAKNVEEYAENVLGMQKIDSSQIKYIKIHTDDVVNIPEQDPGVIGRIKIFFRDCVEYFRG